MEPIKFRVWDVVNSEWFDTTTVVMSQDGRLHFWHMYKKTLEPLDEKTYIPVFFTRLKDKNGEEIYEGDIVKMNGSEKNWEVAYEEHYAAFGFTEEDDWSFLNAYDMEREAEVIGNIYENPELIK